MNFAYIALKALAPKARAFERSTKDPIVSQERVLLEYLSRNKNTEYGLKYNFAGIKTISDYQSLVPMSDCETMRPYIEKMTKGAAGVLTVDNPIFFGMTSGTTNRPKLIPVTKYSRDRKKEVADLWAYYIARDHPGVLKGRILAIISPEIEGYTEAGLPYGAESGHGYKNLPFAIKNLYALPYEVFDIKDYKARHYSILRISMEQNVTTLATLNPSTLVLLCQKIDGWKDDIIKDIEKGTLSDKFDISEGIRRKIKFNPNKARAEELRRILRDRGELLPKYFWPNMQIIECWKGGTVKLYLKELPKFFGDAPIRDFGCLSTEARSSIPMSDEGAGGVLAINTNFYEFVPKEDMGRKKKRFFLCDRLEKGQEYFLIVTTPGGLYRYNIDDIITVDGFFNKTPMIEFVQKGLNAVSIIGEKLYESHVNEAVNGAVDENGVLLDFFSANVEPGPPPRYIFLVEFNTNPPPDKKKALLRSIEEGLYRQNAEYEDKRKSEDLAPPVLKVVRKGEFERYRARKIENGAPDGQFKVPELVLDFDFQDNFAIEEEVYLD